MSNGPRDADGRSRLVRLLSGHQHDPMFDRLAGLAQDRLGAPAGVVTIIDEDRGRQLFRSVRGSWTSIAAERHTPLSHSLCRIVSDSAAPLRINDASQDPRFRDHPAHSELGIGAYLGCPIRARDGDAIGAICVLDREPHDWSDADVRRLTDLAGCVDDAIRLVETLEDAACADRDALRAEAARDLFFVGMNHEVRTEFNGLLGLAGLLEEAAPDARTMDLARRIGGCGARLWHLLAPLLEPSACNRGCGLPKGASRYLREVFSEVVDVLSSTGRFSARRASLAVANDVPALPAAASARARLIFYDLLCEAHEAGGCEDIEASLQDCDTLRLVVRHDPVPGAEDAHRSDETVDWSARGFRGARAVVSACGGEFRVLPVADDAVVVRIDLPIGSCACNSGVARNAP